VVGHPCPQPEQHLVVDGLVLRPVEREPAAGHRERPAGPLAVEVQDNRTAPTGERSVTIRGCTVRRIGPAEGEPELNDRNVGDQLRVKGVLRVIDLPPAFVNCAPIPARVEVRVTEARMV
jgi:hypothetical protein